MCKSLHLDLRFKKKHYDRVVNIYLSRVFHQFCYKDRLVGWLVLQHVTPSWVILYRSLSFLLQVIVNYYCNKLFLVQIIFTLTNSFENFNPILIIYIQLCGFKYFKQLDSFKHLIIVLCKQLLASSPRGVMVNWLAIW